MQIGSSTVVNALLRMGANPNKAGLVGVYSIAFMFFLYQNWSSNRSRMSALDRACSQHRWCPKTSYCHARHSLKIDRNMDETPLLITLDRRLECRDNLCYLMRTRQDFPPTPRWRRKYAQWQEYLKILEALLKSGAVAMMKPVYILDLFTER